MNKSSFRTNVSKVALLALTIQLGAGNVASGETLLNGTLPLPDGGIQAPARKAAVKTTPAPVPVVTSNVATPRATTPNVANIAAPNAVANTAPTANLRTPNNAMPNLVATPAPTMPATSPVTESAQAPALGFKESDNAPVLRGLEPTVAAPPSTPAVSADEPTLRGLDSAAVQASPSVEGASQTAEPAATSAAKTNRISTDSKADSAPSSASRMTRLFHRSPANTTSAAAPPTAAEQPAGPTPAARMRALFHRKASDAAAAPGSSSTPVAHNAASVLPTTAAHAADSTDLHEDEKSSSMQTALTPSAVAPVADTSDLHADEKSFDLTAQKSFHLSAPIKQNPQMALLPTTGATDAGQRASIFIDNDEQVEQQSTVKYEELVLDDSKTKVKAGCKFPIVITSEITSRTAKVGDPVQGRLKYDLKIADRVVASKGATVRGHLNYALQARTPMRSLVSINRWYKNSGCLGISFDEIINERGEHIPLVAEPARTNLYVKNKAEGRVLGINEKGQIAGPWSQQLRYKAIRVGMNAAMSPLGPMTFGAMPIALGVIGAVNPSFAFMKPVGENVRHRRIKGFLWGALSGVPGSWLIEDTTLKGQEAVVKPGDEFLAEFRQEFTGEPATDAEMLGGDNGKVHGEVVGADKNNKLKKLGRKKQSASRPQHTT